MDSPEDHVFVGQLAVNDLSIGEAQGRSSFLNVTGTAKDGGLGFRSFNDDGDETGKPGKPDRRIDFDDGHAGVDIHDKARKAIVLAVQEAVSVGVGFEQCFSNFLCILRPRPHKVCIDLRRTALVQHPNPNRRIRIIQPHPDESILLKTEDYRQVTGPALSLHFSNRTVEKPRVARFEGALTGGSQRNGQTVHGREFSGEK